MTYTSAIYESVQMHVGADVHEEPKHSALAKTVAPLPEQTRLNLTVICLIVLRLGAETKTEANRKRHRQINRRWCQKWPGW
jgi:ABC-type hemin transport system ATPase subunit